MSEAHHFDKEALLSEFEDEIDILQLAIEMFEKKYQALLTEIKVSIGNHDPDQLNFKSHELKGAAANFKCYKIVDLLQKLENMGSNKTIDEALPLLQQLEKDLPMLINELKQIA